MAEKLSFSPPFFLDRARFSSCDTNLVLEIRPSCQSEAGTQTRNVLWHSICNNPRHIRAVHVKGSSVHVQLSTLGSQSSRLSLLQSFIDKLGELLAAGQMKACCKGSFQDPQAP